MMRFNEKTATANKNLARTLLADEIYAFLVEKHGEENVSRVGSAEFSVAMGTVVDKDGFEREICANTKIVAKPYEDSAGTMRATEAYDRETEAAEYEKTCQEKAEKEAKKAAEKEAKIKKLAEAKKKKKQTTEEE